MVDNLYAYGPPHGATIREDLPYAATNRKGRARAWVAERFMAAHAAGDVGVTIARASDYFGRGAVESAVGGRFFGPILAGKAAAVFGDPDAPHSITYVPDFARTLIELAHHDEALGQAWHVPSVPAVYPAFLRACRRGSRNRNAEALPLVPPDAALRGVVRSRRRGDGRDALRVRGAVRPRQQQVREGLRPEADALRRVDPGHRGLVARSCSAGQEVAVGPIGGPGRPSRGSDQPWISAEGIRTSKTQFACRVAPTPGGTTTTCSS